MNETLEQSAVREISEEIGLNVNVTDLVPLCCWQEFYIPKDLQYLIVVFFSELVIEEQLTEVEFISTVGLQLKEVQSCALMPEATWNMLAVSQNSKNPKNHYKGMQGTDLLVKVIFGVICFTVVSSTGEDVKRILGVTTKKDEIEATEISVQDIYGHGPGKGCGKPHRFAVQRLLKYYEEHE